MTALPFQARRFRSTAPNYARYRIPYPPELLERVAGRVGLVPGDAVLDLGCGPAMLAIGFARLGMTAVGMDPEPEMLEAARTEATAAGVDLKLVQGSSYDLDPSMGTFRLVTMGRSFHWMDRRPTLAMLDRMIMPSGAIALFHDRLIAGQPEWRQLLRELFVKYAPQNNAVRQQRESANWQPHEVVLLQSVFSEVETWGRIFVQDLGIDDIVGRAFSMSEASPETLGDRLQEFEAELRGRLRELAPSGRFRDVVAADAIIAFRPGEANRVR